MSLGDDGNLPSVSDPLGRDCGVVALVLMEAGHECEFDKWCEVVEVRGLWYR